jgi:mannose-6-phosphate isomerase-like protein (cupin superfamily)
MGKVVTFASLQYADAGKGARIAAVTGADGREMQAEIVRLAPGAAFTGTVPAGSDRYFYTLSGEAVLSGAGRRQRLPADTFAALQEGTAFTLENAAAGEAELVSVIAPPAGSANGRPGFAGGIAAMPRAQRPVVEIPEAKKRRIHFVDKTAAASERAHAMIVLYERETLTGMHRHPDAESLFVLLSGKVCFNVDGRDVVLGRGQAAHFPAGHRHSLRVAEGDVSFLEFHIPGAYTTVRG